jgi:hypothetical protein
VIRARKASWRLTFIAWGIVLVVWSVLTVALDYDLLVLINRLGGERHRLLVLALALMIALPLLVDFVRNVPRYRHLWQRRQGRDRSTTAWAEQVPSTTPRRFRSSPGSPELTWRERAIVEQGQLAFGDVVRHGDLLSVRFDASWGETITSLPVPAFGAPPREGERAPLLFEPKARIGVAPTLQQLEFMTSQPADKRVSLPAGQVAHQLPSELTVPVYSTLHLVERSSKPNSAQVGELQLSGDRLTLALGHAEPVTVRLDQPLRVELSAYLRTDGTAELNVFVEPRASGAYRASKHTALQFKTELPQGQVDRSLPLAWADACYVASEQLAPLWRKIVEAASEHQDDLSASVVL